MLNKTKLSLSLIGLLNLNACSSTQLISFSIIKESNQCQTAEAKIKAQQILIATDWTQIPNSGLTVSCIAAYEVYRSEIRAIRQNPTADVQWPVEPTQEWE